MLPLISAMPTTARTSFFFQAEDGIRDDVVTGVQTCALPIYPRASANRTRFNATSTPDSHAHVIPRLVGSDNALRTGALAGSMGETVSSWLYCQDSACLSWGCGSPRQRTTR